MGTRARTRIVINGREVTNPFARTLLALVALPAVIVVGVVLFLVLLPLAGLAIAVAIGFASAVLGALVAALARRGPPPDADGPRIIEGTFEVEEPDRQPPRRLPDREE